MRKDDLIRLRHMLDAARNAMTFAEGKRRTDLDQDRMLMFSLVRAVEVIGEAASKVSRNCRDHFSEIPWSGIIGMRHRLIHGYDDIDLDILWETITVGLPPLVRTLNRIIASESAE
ncbi:MAG: HepT-like ribonuclease domain-containing protein [Desulfomonilaceae bacterium]